MTVQLTEAEWAAMDPNDWPHTPPYEIFDALMDDDDNTWWRAGSGHGLNAYDAARERVENLTAELARLRAGILAEAHTAAELFGRDCRAAKVLRALVGED